ncbi:MAG: SRPBCC family protein [Myxococcota bacterium]
MNRFSCVSAALALASVVSLLPSAAEAQPRVPRDDRDAIEVGTVDSRGSDVDTGRAVGIINAPFDDVRRVVHDYANYEAFMPHFRTSRVLAQRGHRAMVYMEVGILRDTVTLWAQLRISSREVEGKTIVEARMTEGNMETFRARWELEPVADGQRTLARFQILVDPDLPAVPNSLIVAENVKSARRAIIRLRRRLVAVQG